MARYVLSSNIYRLRFLLHENRTELHPLLDNFLHLRLLLLARIFLALLKLLFLFRQLLVELCLKLFLLLFDFALGLLTIVVE